ncbi:MAG: flagellar basal body-associated FliL family protein [Treponema sp.]|nr:flagellar basal body-associated FliL family protein [Candidatus Treponema equifaecale]
MKLTLNKVLIYTACLLFILIVGISAVELCIKNAVPGAGLRREDPKPSTMANRGNSFDLIGLMRISTRSDEAENRHVMVLNPWLEYDQENMALYEELDRKLVSIKSTINNYFSSRTKAEIIAMSEEQIKEELKGQINAGLVLGKVTRIYFNDYMFLN